MLVKDDQQMKDVTQVGLWRGTPTNVTCREAAVQQTKQVCFTMSLKASYFTRFWKA